MSEQRVVAVPGLTLRDHIAIEVLSARISRGEQLPTPEELARWAYEIADGMVAYRDAQQTAESIAQAEAMARPGAMDAVLAVAAATIGGRR